MTVPKKPKTKWGHHLYRVLAGPEQIVYVFRSSTHNTCVLTGYDKSKKHWFWMEAGKDPNQEDDDGYSFDPSMHQRGHSSTEEMPHVLAVTLSDLLPFMPNPKGDIWRKHHYFRVNHEPPPKEKIDRGRFGMLV